MIMTEGNTILTPVSQADGKMKNRPAVILRKMPSYGDLLVCGISTQLHQYVSGFDEIISTTDEDFQSSGLLSKSVIRLAFLSVLPSSRILGSIGSISSNRHRNLLKNLSDYLISSDVNVK